MIYLNEVCEKLSEILNGEYNPADFLYAVEAVGYHADTIYDKKAGKNLIRVFVSSMGGNFNPVYGLGEANYTIPITFYFPVRFKDDFFALDAYLHSVFVGAQLNYGTNSGYATSNLSIATYGEIQDLDFSEFKRWADEKYRKPIEATEPYMSMTLNLYLAVIGADYMMGNAFETSLKYSGGYISIRLLDESGFAEGIRCEVLDEAKTYVQPAEVRHYKGFIGLDLKHYYYYEEDTADPKNAFIKKPNGAFEQVGYVSWVSSSVIVGIPMKYAQSSLQRNCQASEEELLQGESETYGLPYSSTIGQTFQIYLQKDMMHSLLMENALHGTLADMEFTLETSIPDMNVKESKKVYIASFIINPVKGTPLTASITFARRME